MVPFYVYAAVSFLAACVFLLIFHEAFLNHYFHPHILAITHTMALGWGTMIILGASHQLVPVLIERKLYSEKLAYLSFLLAAAGIPLLVCGFYEFNMGAPAKWGGRLIVLSILCYLINIATTITKSKHENVHAVFVLTATLWLFFTTLLGLVLVYNFTGDLLQRDSLHYLPLHAHAGITGWFLLLIIGVASRLIPMFLISKYSNPRLLWIIYFLVNAALLFYVYIFFGELPHVFTFFPPLCILLAIAIFIFYCYTSYTQRLRKQVDAQLKMSLLSIIMMVLPILVLFIIIFLILSSSSEQIHLTLAYGFLIFFGWLTSIILGMTFKTLPFIIWNKVYHQHSASGKTPNPKDLFHHPLFTAMSISYLCGFVIFTMGIFVSEAILLKAGAILLILTAVFYNLNILKLIRHKHSV